MYNHFVTRPPSASRAEGREVAELRGLAARVPELAAAVELQVELVTAERRVRARLSTPWVETPVADLQARLSGGEPAVRFAEVPIDWSECRLLFRQVTDALRRHDALDDADAARLHELERHAELPDRAREWFERAAGLPPMLDDVLTWALRPVLSRTADALMPRLTLAAWRRATCPMCGGAPELGYITAGAERLLSCGRCHALWAFDQTACPYCANADRARISTFATQDGWYRVAACQACERYFKMLDGRRADRPLLPAVDAIATLPLDAAAMQKGFR